MNNDSPDRFTRLIVLLTGLGFLIGGIFGYAGLYSSLSGGDERRQVEEELSQIVEIMQIWYSRPEPSGGGRSFLNADFFTIGLSGREGAVTVRSEHANYLLDKLNDQTFDLVALTNTGERAEVRNIGYDTRPQPVWLKEKVDRKF